MLFKNSWRDSAKSRLTCFLFVLASSVALTNCVQKTDKSVSTASEVADEDLLAHQCYAPTRQPSETDKTNWIKKMIPAAQDAERKYGLPAAALVAMTANEGGFGLTRLFLGAKNAYGFKWSPNTAEGKPSWALDCQPPEDGGNKYVKFSNFWDGTLFVGRKLTQMKLYKGATVQYKKQRAAGVSKEKAIDNWVVAIADSGYNYNPGRYKQDIVKTIRNYVSPSWTKSSSYNLYWISK